MKKAIMTFTSLALVAAVSIGGTMAYLTNQTDVTTNVMTVGNVAIEQKEYERQVDSDGNWIRDEENAATFGGITYTPDAMQEFTQDKPIYPAVYTEGSLKWDDRNGSQTSQNENGAHQQPWGAAGAPGSNQLFDSSVKNVIDKFVFVENTGKSDVYYRTFVAVECPEGLEPTLIHVNDTGNSRFTKAGLYAEIDGVQYYVYEYIYNEVLTAGEVSRPSFLQVFLDPAADNEDVALFGDTMDIKVISQAVQVAGFETMGAAKALDEAFAEVDADYIAEIFNS